MRAAFEKIVLPENASFNLMNYVEASFSAPWHFHPELELTWIQRSSGMRLAGDSVEPFAPGDLVLLGAHLPHCWLNSTEWRDGPETSQSLVLQFREDLLGGDFTRLPEHRELAALFAKAGRGLSFSGTERDEICGEMARMEVARPGLPRLAVLLVLLNRLAELADTARPLTSDGYVPRMNQAADGARIDRIVKFVEANYTRPITLAEAAQLANLSTSAFSRYFRAKIGMSFIRFVNELRVSHACRLLIEGDLAITEICFACGYENISNFNRRFLQVRGLSPRDFRRASAR